MDLQLKHKNILITGGAKGIGAAIAELLAQEGGNPIIIGRNEADNEKIASSLKKYDVNLGTYSVELNDQTNYPELFSKIMNDYGHIDGIVNNAGANDGVGLEEGNVTSFIQSIHKNVTHYYGITHSFLSALKKSKGSIVNITSKVASTGQGKTSGYAAANGARNALTREWAVELLPYQIRVNAVAVAESYTPLYQDWIQTLPNPTAMLEKINAAIPLGNRMTTPEEIAHMVLFLLSPVSSHTTGQIIYVDGGYVHLDRAITKNSLL